MIQKFFSTLGVLANERHERKNSDPRIEARGSPPIELGARALSVVCLLRLNYKRLF